MKNKFILAFIIVVAGLFVLHKLQSKIDHVLNETAVLPVSPTPIKKNVDVKTQASTSLFVPYWTLDTNLNQTDAGTLIYFGVTPGDDGLDQLDTGYRQLGFFTEQAAGRKTLLTLRMTDSTQNLAILKDKGRQQQIIQQTVDVAKENGFSGVVLDMELTALPFDSLLSEVTSFNTDLSKAVKKQKLTYGMTLYGDTFYRVRPFDVKQLVPQVDTVYVMAYNFHKIAGNPGPNFPLSGDTTYGYDFQKMVSDFTDLVPPQKLVVVFGMFGNDWTVDDKGNTLSPAVAVTDYQAAKKFLHTCNYSSCRVARDQVSKETKVTYQNGGDKHVVWIEDPTSVTAKKQYSETQGINQFSYWAYGFYQ